MIQKEHAKSQQQMSTLAEQVREHQANVQQQEVDKRHLMGTLQDNNCDFEALIRKIETQVTNLSSHSL